MVGDVHGQRTDLLAALAAVGLADAEGHWTGGAARLWFLGDLLDRGADGVGVIELVMRLCAEAPGQVDALLGNHEVLLLGVRRWEDTLIPLSTGQASFARSWFRNGGRLNDLDRITDAHLDWVRSRPVAAVADDHLLVHSDTLAYLDYGRSADEITEAVHRVVAGDDPYAWWDVWRRLTTRYAFRGPDGPANARTLLGALGGSRIVHGHSPVPDHLGVDPGEVTGPLLYCDGLALNVDTGLVLGGPAAVTRLPYQPAAV